MASAEGRTPSIADATTAASSIGRISSLTLPEMIRFMSSRSSISRACAVALRAIASRPRSSVAASARFISRAFDQPRMALIGVRSSCERVARNSSFSWLTRATSARAAVPSGPALAFLGDAPRFLVEAGVADGDRRLAGDADDDALAARVEHRRPAMAEHQAADRLAASVLDRHREIAAHRPVPAGQRARPGQPGPLRVLEQVVGADRRVAAELRNEQRRRLPGRGRPLGRGAEAGERVQREVRAAPVGGIVEERTVLGAAQLRPVSVTVCRSTPGPARRERAAGLVEQVEDARFLAQRVLGALARGDIAVAPDPAGGSPADRVRPREALEGAAAEELQAVARLAGGGVDRLDARGRRLGIAEQAGSAANQRRMLPVLELAALEAPDLEEALVEDLHPAGLAGDEDRIGGRLERRLHHRQRPCQLLGARLEFAAGAAEVLFDPLAWSWRHRRCATPPSAAVRPRLAFAAHARIPSTCEASAVPCTRARSSRTGVAAGRAVVAERREAAVVGAAEPVDGNVIGRLQQRSRPLGTVDARIDRRAHTDNTCCSGCDARG